MKGLDHIPGYREAVTEERRRRERAWIGLVDDIGDVPIAPLTLRRFVTLAVLGNAYVTAGKAPTVADTVQLLWICSTDYRPDQRAFETWAARTMKKAPIVRLVAGIEAYLAAAFFDANGSDGAAPSTTPAWGWPAAWVDQFAREYGWTVDQVMDTPIAQLFQLERLLVKRIKPDSLFTNPLSDAAKRQWLETQNGRN